ncbi:MAG: hypothetical protein ABR548_11810 [Actinomycetota bacterium]
MSKSCRPRLECEGCRRSLMWLRGSVRG